MSKSPERLAKVLNRDVETPNGRLYDVARVLTAVDFRRRYNEARLYGTENLAALAGRSALILPSHESGFDIPDTDMAARTAGLGYLRYLSKISLPYTRGMGDLFMTMGVVPVVRPGRDAEKYGPAANEAMRRGLIDAHPDTILRRRIAAILTPKAGVEPQQVVGFPEGTRFEGRSPEQLVGPLEPGLFILARRTGALLLPMAIIRDDEDSRLAMVAAPPIDPMRENGRPHSQSAVMDAYRDGLADAVSQAYGYLAD